MTCALLGFECSSIFRFWMPLPGLTNRPIPCSPVPKKKKSEKLSKASIIYKYIGVSVLSLFFLYLENG